LFGVKFRKRGHFFLKMGFAFQSVGKDVHPAYQVFFQGRCNDGPLAVNIFGGGCVSDTEI
jgi:hypothetical protein